MDTLPCPHLAESTVRSRLWGNSSKGTNPLCESLLLLTSCNPNDLLKAPLRIHHRGVRFQDVNLGGTQPFSSQHSERRVKVYRLATRACFGERVGVGGRQRPCPHRCSRVRRQVVKARPSPALPGSPDLPAHPATSPSHPDSRERCAEPSLRQPHHRPLSDHGAIW